MHLSFVRSGDVSVKLQIISLLSLCTTSMLDIVIVGAGIAGLSAAISLRRVGHIVHVYERSAMNNEVGAAINVPPNAVRFLTAWGLDPARWRFDKALLMTFRDPVSMETSSIIGTDETVRSVGGTDLYLAHRVDLHNALKWMATRPDGPGEPVKIHLSTEVVDYVSTHLSFRFNYLSLRIDCSRIHSSPPSDLLAEKKSSATWWSGLTVCIRLHQRTSSAASPNLSTPYTITVAIAS